MTEPYDDESDGGCGGLTGHGGLSGLSGHCGSGETSPEHKPVPVSLWPKHVQNLHADTDLGFSREYEAIQASSTDAALACSHSQMVENKLKNRYINIVAYDHSRVVLRPPTGQKKPPHDYINANYIDVSFTSSFQTERF